MAKIERGGIRLVVENYEQFTRQLNAASASMSGFGQSAQRTASQVNASASEYRGSSVVIEEWTETVDTSAEASAAAAQGMTALGLALGVLGAAAGALLVSFGLQASRIEELGTLLEVTRKNAIYMAEAQGDLTASMEYSSEAIQEQVQGIRDLHLSGEVANRAVADLIRYNLDWTRATELARLAQDAATFAMQDSSEAVKGLIHGITTLQPRILRTYGLMINLNEAYRKYAEANDLVAKNLTIAQRQQAAFQEVLSLAPSIAGAYEAAMGTAAKQVRSLKTDIVNLAEAFGEELTPVMDGVVVAGRDVLHALTDLSDPIQSLLVYSSAAGSALTVVGGAILTLLPRLSALKTAFQGLATSIGISNLALGGWTTAILAGIPLLIGALAALKAHEDARKEEAIAIFEASSSYAEYKTALFNAQLANYTLAESIYETAKAHEEAADAAKAHAEAEQLQAYLDAIKELVGRYGSGRQGLEKFVEIQREFAKNLSDEEMALLADAEAMKQVAFQLGGTTEDAEWFAEALQSLVDAEELMREALERIALGDFEEDTRKAAEEARELTRSMGGVAEGGWRASVALRQYWKELKASAEASRDLVRFQLAEADAFDKASTQIIKAGLDRTRKLEDLDIKYFQQSEDAWIEYQRALQETEGNLAAFHAGTLNELLDLDRDYLQDRNDAWTSYQQDLADAERELQRSIEDANRDRAQRLSDLDAEYAQDRADALRELNEDLEDEAEKHAENLIDIESQRQQSLLDLEEEYQQKLYDIQNLAQKRLRDLQDEYDEKASDTRLKFLREALEQIEQEGWFVGDAYKKLLREAFLFGEGEAGAAIVPNAFRDAYYKLLQELEDLQDDQRWEEEDLSDDLDREQDRRLEDLEEWLAEEQAAIEEAYAGRMAAEEERFAEEQESRRRDYERKLEDLERAHGREQEEIERNHQRRLSDIRLQAEREREELARTYERRLEDLEIEYNRERQLVKEKLEEQNQVARDKYKEALEDIERAKQRERAAINREHDRTKEDIKNDYNDMVMEAADKFNQLPEKFQPVYDALETQARNEMAAVRQAIMDEINGLFTDLEARSPSRVMMRLAESIMGGLEAGGLNPDAASDLIGDAFNAQAFQANIQAALPANMASVPGAMGGSSVSNTTTNQLTVEAQYAHQSEASLRDDLALYNSMMGAWGR